MNGWTRWMLGSGPTQILDGDRGKNYPSKQELRPAGHCLFLSAANVTKTGFEFSSCEFISLERDALLGKGKLRRHDCVLTTRGTVGNVAYFGEQVPYSNVRINSGMVIIRPDQEKILPKFLAFFLRSDAFSRQVKALTSGSAQPQLPIRDLKRVEIFLPPLCEQQKITEVLGALDDKIELNRRATATMEAMAQSIYRSWFVDFDPVRAKSDGHQPALMDAETAALFPDRFNEEGLPDGWQRRAISTVGRCLLGGTPARSKKELWDGDIPWINSGSVNEFRIIRPSETISEEGLQRSSTKLLPKRTTVVAITGATLGQVSLTEIDTCANQSVVGIVTEPPLSSIIYYGILDTVEELIGHQTGGAQQHINKGNVESHELTFATHPVHVAFAKRIDPMLDKVASLLFENQTLSLLSEVLLSKLMSGELQAKEVFEKAEEFV